MCWKEIGAIRLERGIGETRFVMEFQGIVTSGSVTEIVWLASPPKELHTGTVTHGSDTKALAPSTSGAWWLRRTWN